MKSDPEAPTLLDEIAFTAADTKAMRRSAEEARRFPGDDDYFRFLAHASAHLEPSRRTSAGWSPFALPDPWV